MLNHSSCLASEACHRRFELVAPAAYARGRARIGTSGCDAYKATLAVMAIVRMCVCRRQWALRTLSFRDGGH